MNRTLYVLFVGALVTSACGSSDPLLTVPDPTVPSAGRDAGGLGAHCAATADCASFDGFCAKYECFEGRCQPNPTPHGTLLPAEQQVSTECFDRVCDGAGNAVSLTATDTVERRDACMNVKRACTGRERISTLVPEPDGKSCDDGGSVCASGECVKCAAGATCGADKKQSCCASLLVPGGSFRRDNISDATVPAFRLDRYEVTVGRFRRFVDEGFGTQAKPPAVGAGAFDAVNGWQSAWNTSLPSDPTLLKGVLKCTGATWTDAAGANEAKPINCVSWYLAQAFCIRDGGRLPTEVEWIYVAQGGDQNRYYPWSNPPGTTAVSAANAVYSLAATANVGSKSPAGDGRFGHADLGGNLSEWNLDGFGASMPTACTNGCTAALATNAVVRGGSYQTAEANMARGARDPLAAASLNATTGFRCMRAP